MNNMVQLGTVIKVTERHIVLLLEDGTFFNVQRKQDEIPLIGASYEYRPRILFSPYRLMIKYGSMAAVFLLAVMIFSQFNTKTPDAYLVAVDINPSLEIYVSSDELVNSIVPLNQDAERLMKDLDYKKKPIASVMADVISHSVELGYIHKDGSSVIALTVVHLLDHGKQIIDPVHQSVMSVIKLNNILADVRIGTADKQALELAHEQNISINDVVNKQANDLIEQTKETTVEQIGRPEQSPELEIPTVEEQQGSPQNPVKKQNMEPSKTSKPNQIEKTNSVDIPKENKKPIDNKGIEHHEKDPAAKPEPNGKQPTTTEQPRKTEQPQPVPTSHTEKNQEDTVNDSESVIDLQPEEPYPLETPEVGEQAKDGSQDEDDAQSNNQNEQTQHPE